MRKEIFNSKAPDVGICMISCGFEEDDRGIPVDIVSEDCFLIHCVTKGTGTLSDGKKSIDVEKGDLFVVRPGDKITFSSEKDVARSFCWMCFRGRDSEKYLEQVAIYKHTVKRKADTQKFYAIIMNCIDSFDAKGKAPSQARLSAFVLEALDTLKPAGKTRSDPSWLVERALRFIEYNYMRGVSSRDVAMQLGIDRTHFFRIFKAKTRLSPEKYIMQFRVGKACELLRSTDKTVTEIASLVGVGDVFYFSKLFKQLTGLSPSEYRRENL